jgi:hypothetical protein
MPLTPRESSELGRQGLRLPSLGSKDIEQLGLTNVADEEPDEAELERKRNERRRNEAMKAVKVRYNRPLDPLGGETTRADLPSPTPSSPF